MCKHNNEKEKSKFFSWKVFQSFQAECAVRAFFREAASCSAAAASG